jgi:beta-N-acetylhexosaminidase
MTRRHHWPQTLLAAVAIVALGCSATSSPTASPGTKASTPAQSGLPAGSASTEPSPSGLPSEPPSCAQSTLDGMTEAQRVGQLFMVKLPNNVVTSEFKAAVAGYHIGSAWYGRSTSGVAAMRKVSNAVQALATSANTAEAGFLISANQEGGQIQGLSGSGFDTIPSALVQGGMSVDSLEAAAGTWGSQLIDAGVNTDFAPVSDVVPPGTDATNAPIGQLQREYGHSPEIVSDHVTAFISGMQEAGVATTAKHFPGLGRVVGNTDNVAQVVDSTTTMDDPYLDPFGAAIEAGVPFVMISLATYTKIDPDHLAAFSSKIMGDLLRGDLGFDGVIMSDSLSATAVASLTPATRAIRFLEAGGDLIVLTPLSTTMTMAKAVLARTTTNPAFKARVDDAAARVLDAKDLAGLLPCD